MAFGFNGASNIPRHVILTDTILSRGVSNSNSNYPSSDSDDSNHRAKKKARFLDDDSDQENNGCSATACHDPDEPLSSATDESETKNIGSVTRAYSIRIRPDKHAQACLRHIQAGVHFTQNLAVDYLNACTTRQSKNHVRSQIVPEAKLSEVNKWISTTPSSMRSNKVRQMVTNYNTQIAVHGRQNFTMHKKKWRKGKFFTAESDAWNNAGKNFIASVECNTEPRFQGKSRARGYFVLQTRCAKYGNGDPIPPESRRIAFADSPWLVNLLVNDGLYKSFAVKWDKQLNRWYLIVRINVPKTHGPMNVLRNAVAFDPGIKSFATLYDPTGASYSIGGRRYLDYLETKLRWVDHSISKLARVKNNTKEFKEQLMLHPPPSDHAAGIRKSVLQNFRHQLRVTKYRKHAACRKVSNWVKTMHGNVRSFVYSRWDTVLLPRFKTSEMISGLESKTARRMATFSFYRFMNLMLSKAAQDDNFIVRITSEPGTSKTCPLCGHVQNIGNQDEIHCQRCRARMGRDRPRGACGNMQCYVVEPTPDELASILPLIQ
jgi:hypothetical protein